jgi:iron complex outermembrane receptor protein/vitamin B12 transporter
MFRIFRQTGWACGLAFAFTALTLASAQTAIHGTIFDPSGAVVSNAKVEAIQHGVPVASVATDAKGQYHISFKSAGELSLQVTMAGFSTAEKPVAPGDTPELAIDFTLQLASFSEQITVTSTGTPTPQAQLGAAITVVSSSDYEGTRDLAEGLRNVTGVQATQVGQAGGSTQLDIRGGGSDANKVLLDGIPVNDIGGNVEFANVASAAVAQVEVLRGPNSVLYGSDALAGVISLTTTRGSTPSPLFTYAADGGNFGTYREEASMGGQHNQFDYFADYQRFDSNNSIADSKYHNGTFAGNFGWTPSSKDNLRATIHHDQLASGQPSAIELYGIASDAKLANEDAYFGVTWDEQTTARWNNMLRYGGMRLRSNFTEFMPTGIPQYFGSVLADYLGALVTLKDAMGNTVSGQALYQYVETYPNYDPGSTDKDFVYAQSDYRFSPHALALTAFRYEDERGYSFGQSNYVERGNLSYTLELQGDIHSRLFYVLGGGLEKNGLFGFAATPRASLAWQAVSRTKLRASFGKGIKEPAVFDQLESLYALLLLPGSQPQGDQLIAQDHIGPIGPENSRSYDGGIDQTFSGGRNRLSLTLFHNEFSNGIEYIPPQGLTDLGVPSGIVTIAENTQYGATVNSKAFRSAGVEAEVETQLTRSWFVRTGYTYVDALIQKSFANDTGTVVTNPYLPASEASTPIGVYSPLVGARPFRIAPHTGYFQAGYRHAKIFAALRGTLVGRRDDSDFLEYDANGGPSLLLPNRNLDPAYQRLDLTTSYQAARHVAMEGSFQNLLSQHYSEAFGYPALPFMFRLGFKFTMGGESWRRK